VAASYPVAFGVLVSANFTSLVGRTTANIVAVDELLPINWNLGVASRYTAADCSGGRPCRAGDLVIPGMVQTGLVIPLAPAGTVRHLDRQNQLNLSVRRIFRMNKLDVGPELDLYNALNADTVIAERSSNYETATYGVPSSVIIGRLVRLALRVRW
jgi:hypothetical protein